MERAIELEKQRSNPNQLLPPTEHDLEGTCILSSTWQIWLHKFAEFCQDLHLVWEDKIFLI